MSAAKRYSFTKAPPPSPRPPLWTCFVSSEPVTAPPRSRAHFFSSNVKKDLQEFETKIRNARYLSEASFEDIAMRNILLWMIGIPIPVLILLNVFNVI